MIDWYQPAAFDRLFDQNSKRNKLMRKRQVVKLSDADRRLLAAIEHRAFESFTQIARLLHSKEHTVRYRFHGLKQRGIILERVPFVDMYSLGLCVFKIYCELSSGQTTIEKTLIPYLKKLPQVMWLAQLGGDYQLVFSICVKHVGEVYALLKEISDQFGGIFSKTEFVIQVRFCALGRRYLDPGVETAPLLTFGFSPDGTAVIDHIDHAIMRALCKGEYNSETQLADQLKIPLSTVRRRLRNLEKYGVIKGQIYRYNISGIGLHRFNLLVAVKGISPAMAKKMFSFCSKRPQIVNFGECLGPWHFELAVDVENPYETTDIMRDLCQLFGPEVSQVKIVPVFKSYKYSSYPAGDWPANNSLTDRRRDPHLASAKREYRHNSTI